MFLFTTSQDNTKSNKFHLVGKLRTQCSTKTPKHGEKMVPPLLESLLVSQKCLTANMLCLATNFKNDSSPKITSHSTHFRPN